jgi:uncharacterized damage-inducible protein DinB
MKPRIPGFPGEYLWELDIARNQLLALAESAPDPLYPWRPATGVRSFSAILIHIAAVNFGLLHLAGSPAAGDIYGTPPTDESARIMNMIRKNMELEQTVTAKPAVVDLLRRSFDAVTAAFEQASLDDPGEFFGEPTTVRRLFLRILAHSHEHMGQAVAYARAFGIPLPWPDPLKAMQSS